MKKVYNPGASLEFDCEHGRNCSLNFLLERSSASRLVIAILRDSRLAIATSRQNGYYQLTGNSDFNVKSLLQGCWYFLIFLINFN